MSTIGRFIIVFGLIMAQPASSGRAGEPIDFQNDLIPVLTKNGCNAGACHGAAIGRGGFKLSLYGGDPSSDYEQIVKQFEGRRIDLSRPDESLIVLKPAEQLAHGGGNVFDLDDESAQILIEWIKQGAIEDSQRVLTRVEIGPQRSLSKPLGAPLQLVTLAHYSDGSTRNVTKWTIFSAEDASAVDVDSKAATATVLRPGRHIVIGRYLNEVVPIELIVPLSNTPLDLAAETRSNFIDGEVLDSLEVLHLQPSGTIDDARFLRRVTLDLTGRLPASKTVRLVEDRGLDRAKLVDELLASQEFAQYWTIKLAKLLRIRPRNEDTKAMSVYHDWLVEQMNRDFNYQELATTLLTASGDTHKSGPANFFRTTKDARETAEFVSELFMGSRLRCANCHNHPLDRWTQDDYHGLAAIFATINVAQVVVENSTGFTIHPNTLEPATPRIPGERFLDVSEVQSRLQLANWLTDASNPYFTKAIVNRLWKSMLGRGLVEPVDDFRDTNPATHPALLDQLADDFAANGYSLRHTLRLIATSSTYARSADATEANKHDHEFYSHAHRRPLEPEVLADAIAEVLGVPEQYGDHPLGTRAIALADPTTNSLTLDVLGRCGREESCESTPEATGGLPQKLHLLNGKLLNARISAEGSRLRSLLAQNVKTMNIIDEFYLVALSRRPTADELLYWSSELERLPADAKLGFLEDVVWSLLAGREFTTNH